MILDGPLCYSLLDLQPSFGVFRQARLWRFEDA